MGKTIHLSTTLTPQPLKNTIKRPLKSIISDFIKESEKTFPKDRQHVKQMMPFLGTDEIGHQGLYGYGLDLGFLNAILQCYNGHWALKTTPDDWWYTIIRTIAIAIDENAKDKTVRKFFVNHKGKKELVVDVTCIDEIASEDFFRQMTNLIQSNVKVDGYVDAIRSDFSTTTSTHRIVSEITVMSSMQEYFEYTAGIECGIPYIEFLGTEEDWEILKVKFLKLKNMLQPIQKEINLGERWNEVEVICDKLIETIKGNADIEWWTNIIRITSSDYFGSGGPDVSYDGWFITKLLNKPYGSDSLDSLPSGFVSVPLKINNNGAISKAAIVSGIAGMKIDVSKSVPVVEASHGYAIFQ